MQIQVHTLPQAHGLVVVLFQDELPYYRQPTLARAYEAAGHAQPLARRSYRSNTDRRVVATLDAFTGQVLYHQGSLIGVQELIRFYAQVAAAYPQAQTTPFPWHRPANWRTEPSPKARYLNLPIQLRPLPTYAAWTNPIEKLWRFLKQEVLPLHRLADEWVELQHRVDEFLEQFGQGSPELLRYVGLRDLTRLYHSVFEQNPIYVEPRCADGGEHPVALWTFPGPCPKCGAQMERGRLMAIE